MTSIPGKYVLLTGASRGIGPYIAEALAMRGAHLALAARSEEGLRTVASSLSQYKERILILPVDLSSSTQRRQLVATVLNQFGAIDILINNAGLENEGAFVDLTWEALQEMIEVNLAAPIELAHLVLPHMLNRHSGHIVNMASVAAKSGGPFDAVYSGTKAGLAEWARGLRLELKQPGIHFSTIFPGFITQVGMFARFGLTTPFMVGSCTPTQVARAVVGAIEHNKLEVIINSRPLRYIFALNELSPALGDGLMQVSGTVDFQRKKVGL